MTQVDRGAGEAPSDAELILQVRSGDREAFGALYTRHAAAARALARQYVKPGDAEDVVADAFGKLYEMLRRGAGPDSGFRTYLYTVVRHRAYDVSRGANRMRPAEDAEIEAALGRVASSEDPALQGFERSVVSRAYFGLPERWREVLWYCLVDDLKPAQVAPVLGLTPNGVSALLYRAKDALRDGYLQQHLTHAPSDTCRAVNPHLGGYVRDSLSRREKARIEGHLSTCGTCSALVLELADVAHGMKCVVAPLVLGAAGLALVGSAIPLGASLAAAVKAASAGGLTGTAAGGGAAGAGGVGSAAAGGSGIGVGASAAGAGTTAAAGTTTAAGAGATATVGTTTAGAAATAGASVTTTAAGVAGATAGATAVGVVGAGGAAAAGALTVATVGVVAALQIIGTHADAEHRPSEVVVASPEASMSPEPTSSGDPVAPPEERAADPANLLPLVEDLSLSFVGGDSPLEPRRAQDVVLTLENRGGAEVTGTSVRLTLPDGMTMAAQESASGTGIGRSIAGSADEPSSGDPAGRSGDGRTSAPGEKGDPGTGDAARTPPAAAETPSGQAGTADDDDGSGTGSEADADSAAGDQADPARTVCTPGAEPGAVLCDVGLLGAGVTHEVQVTVRAQAGGSYPIAAELRADEIDATSMELPARQVASFGPELTVRSEATGLASPGRGVLPVQIGNTGDRDATSGWSMAVTLPEGVRPAAEQTALVCTVVEARTWSCAAGEPSRITPGHWRDLPLALVALPGAAVATAQATGTASVTPADVSHANGARAQVTVTSAWAGAAHGVGALAAKCVESGGVDEARAQIAGTYTNTTPGTVSVALEAAGDTVSHIDPLSPGESVTLRRDEGIRVPGGSATWVLTRVVEGTAYEHRVPAGELAALDCYDPDWSATAKADTVNAAGRVGVRGTLANTSDEAMSVKMVVKGRSGTLVSEARTVPPGGRETFTVATGRQRLPAGAVTFQLARWTVDKDGDPPTGPARPDAEPKATYGQAVIAPTYVARHAVGAECTYDTDRGASIGTFRIPVDNSASTLPVTFRLGGTTLTVAAGETGTVVTRVPWGTERLPLLSGERTLGDIDVSFPSCAHLGWPDDSVAVQVEARCVDGHEQVVADVRNTSGVTWRGSLVGKYSGRSGHETEVPARGKATLVLPSSAAPVPDLEVLVRLSREFEGTVRTVERGYEVAQVVCWSQDRCQDGSEAPNWFDALFGRHCEDEGGDAGDERVEQATFIPPSIWGRSYGA
ncbi:sigma-70 family RNA polymerase sigma factor [Myceligenerans xiligouense]|uniref:RNA polymerase sigma factor (Sigma-70 family) n=1 Tax=Myceligenerans xiligouense TaxID=253184 RepID=A0A3N4YHS0_9MICO|nr:sigma-70 family RNA polymerase sigma factor [Myceligenerans xiligouense]RPF19657.1 RNA polymerase sigma factor (sigma-70 family) [Myceligenerans xiligouense]